MNRGRAAREVEHPVFRHAALGVQRRFGAKVELQTRIGDFDDQQSSRRVIVGGLDESRYECEIGLGL